MAKQNNSHLETVLCRNPATGQQITTTAKVFNSIYVDKGFELLTRDNADAVATTKRTNSVKGKNEPASLTGSAASIAAGLGIGQAPPDLTGEAMTFPEAAAKSRAERERKSKDPMTPEKALSADVENNDDANTTDIDGPVVTPEREPNKRDRGRG